MATIKINGFAAPYRSKTLRDSADKVVQRNGVLSFSGELSEAGGILTVPPVEFLQKGMIVIAEDPKAIAIPAGLEEPFYLTIRSPSAFKLDDLIYGFAKAPSEINEGLVIIAEKANGTWYPKYALTNDAIIESIEKDRIDFGHTRPLSGLKAVYSAPNIVLDGGSIIDKAGERHDLIGPMIFTPAGSDADYPRVDKIIYRRGLDSEFRIANVQLLTGGTYSTSTKKLYEAEYATSANPHQSVQPVILTDNTVAILTIRGSGEVFSLEYAKYTSNRQVVTVASTVIVSGLDSSEFDVIRDSSNTLYCVYRKSGRITFQRINGATGALVGIEVQLDEGVAAVNHPRIEQLPNTDIAVVYEEQVTPTTKKIMYTTRTSTGALVRSPVRVSAATGGYASPDMAITPESFVHVAYEDTINGTILYKVIDDAGVDVYDALVVSSATIHPTLGVLSSTATKPKIDISSNARVFVAFLQEKPGTEKGLVFWSGGTAKMQDLINISEDILNYDFQILPTSNAKNITIARASSIDHVHLSDKGDILFSQNIAANGANDVAVVDDIHGSLLHAWALPSASSYTDYGSPLDVQHIGPQNISGLINSINLNANEMLVATADAPTNIGNRVTVSGSSESNDGVYYVVQLTQLNIDAPNDYILVQVDSNFTGPESDPANVKAQYAQIDGNAARFIKTVAESESRAYTVDELPTDVLIARVVQPGNQIINYIPGNEPLSNSDTLGIFGSTVISWEAPNAGELVVTGTTRILDFFNNIEYSILGDTLNLNEGDAVYVILDGVDTNPELNVAQVDLLPWDAPIQVFGFVRNGNFVPKFLAEADIDELIPGESGTIGEDLPVKLRERLGLVDDDNFVPYSNTNIIESDDSYPIAISKLDQQVQDILDANPEEDNFVVVNPAGQSLFSTSLFTWEFDHTITDIFVFVNGRKMRQSKTGDLDYDFRKTSPNTIEFAYTIPYNATVTIWNTIMGGGGSGGGGSLEVQQGGNPVDSATNIINFDGSGVSVTQESPGNVKVTIDAGATQRIVKQVLNNTGVAIPQYSALTWLPNGSIALADANMSSLSLFAGIAAEAIPNGQYGTAVKGGNVPNALNALGLAPGSYVYLGETPGQLTTTPPPGLTDTIFKVGKAEPPDGAAQSNAVDLFLEPEVIAAP